MGKYEHSMYVNATYGAVELATVLDICEPEMAAFNYAGNNVYPTTPAPNSATRDVHRAPNPEIHSTQYYSCCTLPS